MSAAEFLRFSTIPRAPCTTFGEAVARNLEISSALPGHRLVSLRPFKTCPASSVQKNRAALLCPHSPRLTISPSQHPTEFGQRDRHAQELQYHRGLQERRQDRALQPARGRDLEEHRGGQVHRPPQSLPRHNLCRPQEVQVFLLVRVPRLRRQARMGDRRRVASCRGSPRCGSGACCDPSSTVWTPSNLPASSPRSRHSCTRPRAPSSSSAPSTAKLPSPPSKSTPPSSRTSRQQTASSASSTPPPSRRTRAGRSATSSPTSARFTPRRRRACACCAGATSSPPWARRRAGSGCSSRAGRQRQRRRRRGRRRLGGRRTSRASSVRASRTLRP